jgi:signal transduction histidine kinase
LENARLKIIPENASVIEVKMHLNDALPLVETSSDMLTEAFSILMKNAVEAIQAKGSRNGLLTLSSDLADGSQILVKVEDNGSGIKEENLKNVFKMRWSTKESGLGFGLFWAKDFIEGMGGRIEVESIWQEGTAFQIYLPTN